MQFNGIIFFSPRELQAIEKAIDYVTEYPEKPIHVESLSFQFSIATRKLQEGFLSRTGFTVHDYIQHIKLLKAKTFLLDLDQTVKEISNILGFRNHSHFSRFFKKYTGKTPTEYRYTNLV